MSKSIIIRTFNEAAHINRLLYGISQQTHPNLEIIIVDSGSTDRTLEIASQYPVRIVHISPEDFTFGRSLNRGIAAASGEIVIFISAHCYPIYPDWLDQITKSFEKNSIALSYGRQIGGKSNYFSERQFFRKYFPENSVVQQSHPYSHNANAAIRREIWERHPFDENLTGLEDLAWSSWVMEEGYSIAYVAEAEVIHVHDETYKQVQKRYQREAIAMKQILPNSQFSFSDFLKIWVSSSLSDLNEARHENSLHKHWWSIIQFRLRQYWGTYRGFHYAGQIDSQLHRSFYYPPNILDKKTPKPRPINPIKYREE